jgi:hypothetical protein
MSDNKVATYLAQNPKMTGVLFTIMLVLSQAGNVAAGHSSVAGP